MGKKRAAGTDKGLKKKKENTEERREIRLPATLPPRCFYYPTTATNEEANNYLDYCCGIDASLVTPATATHLADYYERARPVTGNRLWEPPEDRWLPERARSCQALAPAEERPQDDTLPDFRRGVKFLPLRLCLLCTIYRQQVRLDRESSEIAYASRVDVDGCAEDFFSRGPNALAFQFPSCDIVRLDSDTIRLPASTTIRRGNYWLPTRDGRVETLYNVVDLFDNVYVDEYGNVDCDALRK